MDLYHILRGFLLILEISPVLYSKPVTRYFATFVKMRYDSTVHILFFA